MLLGTLRAAIQATIPVRAAIVALAATGARNAIAEFCLATAIASTSPLPAIARPAAASGLATCKPAPPASHGLPAAGTRPIGKFMAAAGTRAAGSSQAGSGPPEGVGNRESIGQTLARVSIVYTALAGGLYDTWGALGEVSPLFEDRNGEVKAEGLDFHPGALRQGRWYLWSAEAPLDARTARALFSGQGLEITGPPQSVPELLSDYAVVFQQPDGDSSWLVPWLEARLREKAQYPDIRSARGSLFPARSASGTSVWLLSEDGSLPSPEALREADGWHPIPSLWTRVLRGSRKTHLVAFQRRFGGPALHAAAERLRAERKALRVDAGNLIDAASEAGIEGALADTLDELPKMGLDALVPYQYELRLPAEAQRRLGAMVPLVAANLTPPPGIAIRPYVIREVNGVRIAIVGIADVATLAQYGLLGTRSGWKGEDDAVKALERALEDARLDGADGVVLVTSAEREELEALREACRGCAAILTRHRLHREWTFRERFESADHGRVRQPLPWIVAGAGSGTLGVLELEFRTAEPAHPGGPPTWRLVAATNEGIVVPDDMPADPAKHWRSFELQSDHVEARRELMLPDVRLLSARHPRFVRRGGEPLLLLGEAEWSRLVASALRRSSGAELAIVHRIRGGSRIVGSIPLFVAEEWLPGDVRVALAQLSGADIRRLMAGDPDGTRFSTAGFDPDQNRIGGRPLVDGERYLVATVDSLAGNDKFQGVFRDGFTTRLRLAGDRIVTGRNGDSLGVREAVLARLTAMKTRHRGFDDEYLDELAGLLGDDGTAYEPRWTFSLKPAEGAFQQLSVTNRDAFGAVRNSRVNAPNNTSARGKANMALTYETGDLDWENKAQLDYQRSEIQGAAGPVIQEANDNIQFTSEFRLKVFKLQTRRSELELVPFVNGNLITEFTPTEDPKTGAKNPRRQELNGILGAVLYPGTWIKEVRLGAIAKHDLAVATGSLEPGVQLAAILEQPIGPATWTTEFDLKNFFRTPDDGPADLGLLGQVTTGLRVPLFGAFSLRVGLDAMVFSGKLGANPPMGSSIVPSVGLSYHATFKPAVGLAY